MTITECKAIYKKVLELPRPAMFERSQRTAYLLEIFSGNPDEFCQFIGFMKAELSAIKMRRDEAVSIMSDIALAALCIGRRDGQDEYLRRYGRPEFQFLLENKKQVVA